eukprot:Opistho-2@84943
MLKMPLLRDMTAAVGETTASRAGCGDDRSAEKNCGRVDANSSDSNIDNSSNGSSNGNDAHKSPSAGALWTGFHKKSIKERQDQMRLAFPHLRHDALDGLDHSVADVMVENCIGTVSLPVGLGLNFLINGRAYTVPMAVEEPSVVAAASGAAKLIGACGGFVASHSEKSIMIGQLHVVDLGDPEAAAAKLVSMRDDPMYSALI